MFLKDLLIALFLDNSNQLYGALGNFIIIFSNSVIIIIDLVSCIFFNLNLKGQIWKDKFELKFTFFIQAIVAPTVWVKAQPRVPMYTKLAELPTPERVTELAVPTKTLPLVLVNTVALPALKLTKVTWVPKLADFGRSKLATAALLSTRTVRASGLALIKLAPEPEIVRVALPD